MSKEYGRFDVRFPDGSKVRFDITDPLITVGSDPGSGLKLIHPGVPARAAVFTWSNGSATMSAEGSTLLVNGRSFTTHVLAAGDEISIGDFTLRYSPPTGATVAAVRPPGKVSGGAPSPTPKHSPRATAPVPTRPAAVSPSPLRPPAAPVVLHQLPSVVRGTPTSHLLQAGALRIGRDAKNDLVLDHVQVSRFHARLETQGTVRLLRDMRSANGTFVNGRRIHTCPLQAGDEIRISDFLLNFDGATLLRSSEEGNARLDAIGLRREVAGGQVILQDVSLSILPRELVAVVGGSGAGKSTLVNALSGFRAADAGVVLLNGADFYANLDAFRSTLGYVPQDDIVHAELTPARVLQYAALLRLPSGTPDAERLRRVEQVLTDLQLVAQRDVPVHRLSGGQRKRVSIGVELLTRPRLFFLDEPTSGLDPGMEEEMMKILRRLADQDHTIIVITHATENITMCDHVAFMARGGRLVFYGPPTEALAYFNAARFTEIYRQVDGTRSPEQWAQAWRQSPQHQRWVGDRRREVDALVARAKAARTKPAASSSGRLEVSSVRQFAILCRRYLEVLLSDRFNLAILLGQAPLLAVILLVVVWGDADLFRPYVSPAGGPADIAEAQRLAGEVMGKAKIVVFLLTFFSMMCGTINSVREIVKELPIYRRERTVSLGVVPYVLSKFAVLGTISALQTAIMVGIVFSQVHAPPQVEAFVPGAFVTLLGVNLAGVSLGLAVSAVVDNQNTAIAMLPVVLLSQVALAGILTEPKVLKFLSDGTILKWGFGLLGHLARLWTLLPASDNAHTPYQQLYRLCDVPEGPYALVGMIVLFLFLACLLQRSRDRVRD